MKKYIRLSFLVVIFFAAGSINSAVANGMLSSAHASSPANEELQQNDLQRGMSEYQSHNYQRAIEILTDIDQPIARLFLAKSYYGAGNFSKAIEVASPLSQRPPIQIANEAQFTRALSHYQRKEYSVSLDLLYFLGSDAVDVSLREDAKELYSSIVDYLSVNQRINVLRNNRNINIKTDVIKDEFLGRYTSGQALDFIRDYERITNGQSTDQVRNVAQSLPESPVELPDLSNIPHGTVYRIGVILPGFEDNDSDRMVSSGIYGGLMLAADAFNRANSDTKVKLIFKDSEQYSSRMGNIVNELVEEEFVDVIIGPLFSEQVAQLSGLVDRRSIPLFAPLANTITVSDDNRYVFQINPSFEARGRQFAQFAVRDHGANRVGIISERGSYSETEATAFKNEVERLGGEVVHFFNEDFTARGLSVGHLMPWFANNQDLIQDTINYRAESLDAVFLSFSSDVAETLLDLTLTGLEAFNPDYMVISNETMTYLDHSLNRIRRLNMIYADTYFLNEGDEIAINFRYDYQNRTGAEPSIFSHVGYDIGMYYLSLINAVGNPDNLRDYIHLIEPFDGIATTIYFGDEQMNKSLQYFKLTTEGTVKITDSPNREIFDAKSDEDFEEF
ncbi:MAG: ABC transporter substrate-binding protein [Balneolales bacterium]|nr:ABC transporter substrate-binding protein [Balneolales bacterium]